MGITTSEMADRQNTMVMPARETAWIVVHQIKVMTPLNMTTARTTKLISSPDGQREISESGN